MLHLSRGRKGEYLISWCGIFFRHPRNLTVDLKKTHCHKCKKAFDEAPSTSQVKKILLGHNEDLNNETIKKDITAVMANVEEAVKKESVEGNTDKEV